MLVSLTQILLNQKIKKIHVVNLQMDGEDLKQRLINLIFFKTYVCEI
jgi:hypothetical protein